MLLRRESLALAAVLVLASQSFAQSISFDTVDAVAKGAAKVEAVHGGVQLQIDDPRGDSALRLEPKKPATTWDVSKWDILAVDVENLSAETQARLLLSMTAAGPEKREKKDYREANVGIALNPGEKRTLRLKLPHRWKYAAPDGMPGIHSIDTANVARIEFLLQWPFEHAWPGLLNCRLTNLHFEGPLTPTAPLTAAQYTPFIDKYGQFIAQ